MADQGNTGRPASRSLMDRAAESIPGGVNSSSRTHALYTPSGEPISFASASGAEITDREGRTYVDYANAWGPIVLGHCDEAVNRAVARAVSSRDQIGLGTSELEARAAELVREHVPSAAKVQFGTTGTEVVAAAVRLARHVTGRDTVVKCQGHYHGSYGPLSCNFLSDPEDLDRIDPNASGFLPTAFDATEVVPFNDPAALEAVLERESVAAIVLEPVAHNMGVVEPADGYLATLRELADEHGTLLVFDEMITGFRHAMGGYQSIAGVHPDLTTLGKALGNGYPVSALAGREEYMMELDTATEGEGAYFAGTYNGHTASMAAVVETLSQLHRRRVHDGFERHRTELVAGIADQAEDAGVDDAWVSGCGGAYTTVFGPRPPTDYEDLLDLDVDRFLAYRWELVDRGVMTPPRFPKPNLLSGAMTDAHVQQTIEAAGAALRAVE